MFRWFTDATDLRAYADAIEPFQRTCEAYLTKQHNLDGYCHACASITRFKVNSGELFGQEPNLREGLICERCGLSNRNRLLASAILEERRWGSNSRVLLFERFSLLYDWLKTIFPELIGKEYLSEVQIPGTIRNIHGIEVRHESMTRTSFANNSFDLVLHNDVLEHVYDYLSALADSFRILSPNGVLIFTTPFFLRLPNNLNKATLNADGTITHHAEPEYHGNPMNSDGALTFHHYSWRLVEAVRAVGFRQAGVGVHYNVFAELVSNNHPDFAHGNMLPIVIRGRKSA